MTISVLGNYRVLSRTALGLALFGWCGPVWARSEGISSTACTGCHGGTAESTLSIRLEPAQLEPGATGTLIVEVSGSNTIEAGIAVIGPGVGVFTVPAGQELTTFDDWVTHTKPKEAEGGVVEFRVEWTAPNEVGVAQFDVAALATNGDGRASGDRPSAGSLTVGYGCEPITVYWDDDGDGFGREDAWRVACDEDEDFVKVFGDCADSDAARYPGADELCNGVDDDCDGESDEEVVTKTFYVDFDEDGWGDPNTGVGTCTPEPGYVDNGLDCNDQAATNHPDGAEVCDYVDNDCDDKVDEGVRPTCGVGLCVRLSDLCDSVAFCTPGEPLTELCNGLDDDCDGMTDEEGCPDGQVCSQNQCVNAEDAPTSSSTPTVSEPAPATTNTPGTLDSTVLDVSQPASSSAVGTSPQDNPPNATPDATSSDPNDQGDEPAKPPEGCSCKVGRDSRSPLGVGSVVGLLLLSLVRLRQRSTRS